MKMLKERAMGIAQDIVDNLRHLADGKVDLMGSELSRAALVIEALADLCNPDCPTSRQILDKVGTEQYWNSDTELKLLLDYLDEVWSNLDNVTNSTHFQRYLTSRAEFRNLGTGVSNP